MAQAVAFQYTANGQVYQLPTPKKPCLALPSMPKVPRLERAWTKKPSDLKDEDYSSFYRELYPMQDTNAYALL